MHNIFLQKERPVKYFTEKGRPLNLNKTDVEFNFQEEDDKFVLEVFTYK